MLDINAIQKLQKITNSFLFKNNNVSKTISKGALISFNYKFWQNDPYPMVIVSNFTTGVKVRGINLHYLTYPSIRQLLGIAQVSGGAFSFQSIKSNNYLSSAFRVYKWNGIQAMKILDAKFIMDIISATRSTNPNEIQELRKFVQEQIQKQVNISADQLKNQQVQSNNNII